jgi:hypothetical protein
MCPTPCAPGVEEKRRDHGVSAAPDYVSRQSDERGEAPLPAALLAAFEAVSSTGKAAGYVRDRHEVGPEVRGLLCSVETMAKPWLSLAPTLLAALVFAGDASAADTSIALGNVAVPPASSGVDRAALKSAAEGELSGVDPAMLRKLHKKRAVLVSVAVIGGQQSPFTCTVNAMLHDAKTGTMLAIIEGRAKAEGDANLALRKQVLRAAMHSAMSQIPAALAAN